MAATYKGKPMRYFLIDRLAAGFDEKTVCSMFRVFFEVTDTDEEILKIIEDRETANQEIDARRHEIVDEIGRTNIIGIILKQINRLDQMTDQTDDVHDLVKIISTLNASVATIKPRQEDKPVEHKSLTVNYYNQFNANFLLDLEGQRIIQITDREKFNRLFLPPSDAVIEPEFKTISEPPKKKKTDGGPDGIGAYVR